MKKQTKKKKSSPFIYVEPADYFPEEVRRACGLGEYAKPKPDGDTPAQEDKPE